MKKTVTLSAVILLTLTANAQTWCVPASAVPYNANQPGITQFTLNTISRTSTDLENFPSNSYVLTGMSTTLTAGVTYTVTMTYTIDPQICPDMNLRVWIDYNQDGQLNDPGETVISVNNQLPGTYTGTFMVPLTASGGTTRLRATAKMTSNGGHILPTPCDIPADPLGYHGEIEDYDVTIINPNAVSEQSEQLRDMQLFPNPAQGNSTLRYTLVQSNTVHAEIVTLTGQRVTVLADYNNQAPGTYTLQLPDKLAPGIYIVRLTAGAIVEEKKLVIIP